MFYWPPRAMLDDWSSESFQFMWAKSRRFEATFYQNRKIQNNKLRRCSKREALSCTALYNDKHSGSTFVIEQRKWQDRLSASEEIFISLKFIINPKVTMKLLKIFAPIAIVFLCVISSAVADSTEKNETWVHGYVLHHAVSNKTSVSVSATFQRSRRLNQQQLMSQLNLQSSLLKTSQKYRRRKTQRPSRRQPLKTPSISVTPKMTKRAQRSLQHQCRCWVGWLW
jgi:hypothetical protein